MPVKEIDFYGYLLADTGVLHIFAPDNEANEGNEDRSLLLLP